MNKRSCVVCGETFFAPPSSKKITCSPPCSSIRKTASHVGKSNQWSIEARARLAKNGQTPNLTKGTGAALKSPVSGPFESNQEAKRWWVISPDGDTYEVVNLAKWCRDNPDLFDGHSHRLANHGLRQIQLSLMGRTKRRVSSWHGWSLKRQNETILKR